jgi:innexin
VTDDNSPVNLEIVINPSHPFSLSHPYRLVRRDAIEIIVRRSKMGDWFLLYMLGENIDSIIFRDVMGDLANRLNNNQHHRVPGLKGDSQDA